MASRLSKQIIHKGQGVMACDILLRHCICEGVEREGRQDMDTQGSRVLDLRGEKLCVNWTHYHPYK